MFTEETPSGEKQKPQRSFSLHSLQRRLTTADGAGGASCSPSGRNRLLLNDRYGGTTPEQRSEVKTNKEPPKEIMNPERE